jgi:hypothetical protein
LSPHQAAREFARLETLELYHARLKGDFDEAEQAIRRTLRLTRDLRPRGSLVSQLVSFAIEGLVLYGMGDFTLSQPGMDPKRCDRLLAILAEHQRDPVSPIEEGIRMEYLDQRNTLDDLQQGRRKVDQVVNFGVNPNDAQRAILDQLKHTNWQTEIAACNRGFAVLLATAKRTVHEVLASDPIATEAAKSKAEGAVLMGLEMPAMQAFFSAEERQRAGLAGRQCLIIVRRYALTHNSLPRTLRRQPGKQDSMLSRSIRFAASPCATRSSTASLSSTQSVSITKTTAEPSTRTGRQYLAIFFTR